MTQASATNRAPAPVTATTISVRPIHSEADYAATLEEVAALMSAAPDTPEADRLDVLTTLVEAYEAKHYPIDPPDPIEAIRFRMEQQGLTAQDLEAFIGTRARVSEVLNRRRPLSLAMIRRLTEGLGIPAAVLIRPTGAPSTRQPPRRNARKTASTRRGATAAAPERAPPRGGATASGIRRGKTTAKSARKAPAPRRPVLH